MVDYIPQTLLRLLAVYGSILLLTGLTASYGYKRHSARAHQILVLFMLGAMIIPGLHLLVKNLKWGLLPSKPLPETAVVSVPTTVGTTEVTAPVTMAPLPSVPLENDTASPVIDKTTSINWNLYISGVWLLASALLLGRTVLAYIRTGRLISQSVPIPSPALQTSLQRACTRFQLQRGIDLHSHPDIQTPSIWCWSKPPVLLAPPSLTDDQCWEGVLCHELAHYQRYDHLSALLAELAVCILPWNPLAWMARRRLTFLSEQACDDWVLACDSDGTRYAESLLDMLPTTRLAATLSVATSKKGVAHRVRRILQGQTGNPRLNRYWMLGTSLAIGLLIAAICLAQTQPNTPNPEAFAISTDRLVQLTAVDSNELTLDRLADICAAMEDSFANIHVCYEFTVDPTPKVEDVVGSSMIINDSPAQEELLISLRTGKVRHVNAGHYRTANGDSWQQTMTSSYDGKVSIRLDTFTSPNRQADASIFKGKHFIPPVGVTPLGFSILMWTLDEKFTPLSSLLREHQDSITLTNGVIVNGFNCIRIDLLQNPGGRAYRRLYFSVDHGYTPVRYEYLVGDEEISLWVAAETLQPVAKGLWFPSRGRTQSNNTTSIYQTTQPVVINTTITEKDFEIIFPTGTDVDDEVSGRSYVVNPTPQQLKQEAQYRVEHATEIETQQQEGGRLYSNGKLRRLSTARDMYFSDHDKSLPQTLDDLKLYLSEEELHWCQANVVLVPIDLKDPNIDVANTALAYDKTLIQNGQTNVLFINGMVQCVDTQKLYELGLAHSAITIQVLDTHNQPVSNAVVTDNVTFQQFETNELGKIQWRLSPSSPCPNFFSAVDQPRGLSGCTGYSAGKEEITIHVKPTILAGIIAQGPQKEPLDHVRIYSLGGDPVTLNYTQSDRKGRFVVPIPTKTNQQGITLIALAPQQRLASMLKIDPESPPASIQLETGYTVTAQLVDPNNEPVSGRAIADFAAFFTGTDNVTIAASGIGLSIDDQGQLTIPVLPRMKEFHLVGLTESHLKLQMIIQGEQMQTPDLDLGTIVMKSY